MKNLLALFIATLFTLPALAQKVPMNSATYDVKILRVSDGDTIVIAAPYLPPPLKPELAVRIYGVDTPEKVTVPNVRKNFKKHRWLVIILNSLLPRVVRYKLHYIPGINLEAGYLEISL